MVGEFRPTETVGATKSIFLEKKINAPRKVNLVVKARSDTSSNVPLALQPLPLTRNQKFLVFMSNRAIADRLDSGVRYRI